MKVLFDHQIFSMQRYGGISRYFANLHKSLPVRSVDTSLGVLYSDNYYIKELSSGGSFLTQKLLKRDSRKYKWNKWYSRYLIGRNDFDVFHPTYYHSYFLKKLKKPFVLTVHDMIHEVYPEYFMNDPYKEYKAQVIERADRIIAISESTKRDILRFFSIPEDRITVVHHGHQFTHPSPVIDPQPKITGSFVLFVGEREGYKNFSRFVEAIAELLLQSNVKLVCAGGKPFSEAELHRINQLKLQNHVVQLTVADDQLRDLYSKALMFVFPSLYEGFGLPILEAFEHSCPVVMSNTSCFPEVGGDAAVYFDPLNSESIRTSVTGVFENSFLREQLRERGKHRLAQFTIKDCVDRTLEVYKGCI